MSSATAQGWSTAVSWSLANHLPDQAVWFAEAGLAEAQHNSTSSHDPALHSALEAAASAYMAAGKPQAVYLLLKPHSMGPSRAIRYLFARACLTLGDSDRLHEAESSLMLTSSDSSLVLNGPELYTLAHLARRSGRSELAKSRFADAVRAAPLLWLAWQELAKLGGDSTLPCASAFSPANAGPLAESLFANPPEGVVSVAPSQGASGAQAHSGSSSSSTTTTTSNTAADIPEDPASPSPTPASPSPATPVPSGPPATPSTPSLATPFTPQKNPWMQTVPGAPRRGMAQAAQPTPTPNAEVRRSHRLASSSKPPRPNTAGSSLSASTSTVTTVSSTSPPSSLAQLESAFAAVLPIMASMASIYSLLTKYKCAEAEQALDTLPIEQSTSSWAQLIRGTARFERIDYTGSVTAFAALRKRAPHITTGMELYSTALWHLNKEVELSYLAQELVHSNRTAPQTWVVVGNCFSAAKDHEAALTCFQRATQVAPDFTYAYTLAGHEYIASENFDKATACFRHALRSDPRHYNAWYGLGSLFLRQERYPMAEYHFKRALAIHPTSAVLHCYTGISLHAAGQPLEALQCFETAITIDPKNPLAKLKKAKVLMALERHQEAVSLLERLKDYAFQEAAVSYMLGKAYKSIGYTEKARSSFLVALDLDPTNASTIKNAIDRVEHDGELEDIY